MLSFLLFIFIFVVVLVLIVISSVLGFVRSVFGLGKRTVSTGTSHDDFQQQANKSKVFDKNEGEYVDYEEIK